VNWRRNASQVLRSGKPVGGSKVPSTFVRQLDRCVTLSSGRQAPGAQTSRLRSLVSVRSIVRWAAGKSSAARCSRHIPPSAPVQGRLQCPPAKSKFLAVSQCQLIPPSHPPPHNNIPLPPNFPSNGNSPFAILPCSFFQNPKNPAVANARK
jgi:hypothetical protein